MAFGLTLGVHQHTAALMTCPLNVRLPLASRSMIRPVLGP